jgi:SAM-dependent methyltransferase
MATQRRLVFGEVAEVYDRYRPTYPSRLIDDLVELAGARDGGRFLEVGAGTGKATQLFAQRGIAVLAVEPSPAMAEVARRNCAGYPSVEIVESDFERLDLGGETFGLVYSGQAWHWVDPAVGYARARAALPAGGVLAPFWNRAAWGESELRDALADVYRRIVPGMATDGPMHPLNPSPEADQDWLGEIGALPTFSDAEVRIYRWSHSYSAADYAGLVSTVSEVRLLDPERRERLLAAVVETIEQRGGTIVFPWATRLCLARAA